MFIKNASRRFFLSLDLKFMAERLDVKSMNKTCYKVIKFNSPDFSRDIRLNKS